MSGKQNYFSNVLSIKRLESFVSEYNTENRVVFVPITSRQIGFSVANSFGILTRHFGTESFLDDDLYSIVRASYAAFEVALMKASPNGGHTRGDLKFERYAFDQFLNDSFDDTRKLSRLLGVVVNMIGSFEHDDCEFKVVMAPTVTMPNGLIVPFPETIRFRNLRDTVVALNDPETPAAARVNFKRYCPLPGAIWVGTEDSPILKNPDDFMPPDYDIEEDLPQDLDCLEAMIESLDRASPKYNSLKTKFDGVGHPSLLVSNNIAEVRCIDRRRRETLDAYYRRLDREGPVEGSHGGYYGQESCEDFDLLMGAANLLGECPNFLPNRDKYYAFRSEGLSSWGAALEYSEIMNLLFDV